MAATHSLIAQQAELERQAEEAQLLAENALLGERAVSILRLITWGLLGVAFSGGEKDAHADPSQGDPVWHIALIVGWFVFAVVVLVVLRRVKFTPRRALYWPLGFMVVDFGVFVCLAATTRDVPSGEISVGTLAILLSFSVARFRSVHVVVSALLATVGYLLEARVQHFLDWRNGLVVAAAYACLGVVVWWANRRVRRMFVDVRQSENLARLLPRQVASRILKQGGSALRPIEREVTILFSDIRDFTSMSQRMDPQAVLSLLDGYFARMSAIVKGHDGMVNKFLGDGMLAVWGVPDALPDHARRAVKAALDMRAAVLELNAEHEKSGLPALRIGIGIHTGKVAAGMLGGTEQSEYTVIGDAVNLASRIEGLTKKAQTDVLVSASAWAECGGAFVGEPFGSESVKGRDEPVTVYRLTGRATS